MEYGIIIWIYDMETYGHLPLQKMGWIWIYDTCFIAKLD